MRIQSHGIDAELPPGWEAEIVVRDAEPAEGTGAAGRAAVSETMMPVAHFANFPLPGERGDFGSNAVEVMHAGDLLVCLIEYDRASASSELYAREGLPTIQPDQFSPESMQRALPGQSGTQEFFHVGDRAFCLYVVLGSHARRREAADTVNAFLRDLSIDPQG